jgi:hypothetical protein
MCQHLWTYCNVQDIISRCGHYSEKTRHAALVGLRSFFQQHPKSLASSLSSVLPAIATLVADEDEACRAAVHEIWQQLITPSVPQNDLAPFMSLIMAHVRCACVQISADVRLDGFRFLEALVQCCPGVVAAAHQAAVLQLFAAALSQVWLYFW